MNKRQRSAHLTIWIFLLMVLVALLGMVLLARQERLNAIGGG